MRFISRSILLTLAAVGTLTAAAATGKPAVTNAPAPAQAVAPVPRSTFGIPTKPEDGHDPFFPGSDRLFAVKTAPKSPSGAGAAIVFNGISGSQDRRFAMINGYTFAEGEQAFVNTPSGRVMVHCLEIKGETVTVEIAGERRELRLKGR